MNSREILYQNFPRMVGDPAQRDVENMSELNRFATVTSGNNDQCYASCCSYLGNIPVFEDLFLETDILKLEPIQKVVTWYEDRGIECVILYSGSRGIHIHGLFEPEIVSKQIVRNFANEIIKDTKTLDDFDPHVTGDIRRLCRIPETQRLNGRWCTSITKEELFSDSIEEIKRRSFVPRYINYKAKKRPKITEFVKDIPEEIHSEVVITPSTPKNIFFMKDVLRPCVYEKLLTPNPNEYYRLTSVIEAMNHGISTDQIMSVFEKLHWIDFDRSYTRYKVEYVEQKRIEGDSTLKVPIGKKKLGCNKKHSCIKCVLAGKII